MQTIEYLIAWDNGTWTTENHDVPGLGEDPENGVKNFGDLGELADYAQRCIQTQTQYRKSVLFAVYGIYGISEEADR